MRIKVERIGINVKCLTFSNTLKIQDGIKMLLGIRKHRYSCIYFISDPKF